MDLIRRSAHEQLDALNRGEVSSRELTTAHLDRITSHPHYNAVVTLSAEAALATAAAADEQRARGQATALLGLPITLKDALETEGLRTVCGTGELSEHVPQRDADAVALLAHPSLRGGLGELQVEDVPVLDLEPVRADVVLGFAELAHDLEVGQAGLLAGLAQGGGLRSLPGADAAGGDLDGDAEFREALDNVMLHPSLRKESRPWAGRECGPWPGAAKRRSSLRRWGGGQSGRFWFSMYSLTVASGAPPQEPAK